MSRNAKTSSAAIIHTTADALNLPKIPDAYRVKNMLSGRYEEPPRATSDWRPEPHGSPYWHVFYTEATDGIRTFISPENALTLIESGKGDLADRDKALQDVRRALDRANATAVRKTYFAPVVASWKRYRVEVADELRKVTGFDEEENVLHGVETWLTVAEVAKAYRVSESTVRRLNLPHIKVGGQYRFPASAVIRTLESAA